jgi:Ca2+-binding RTX toxin-like protein
MSMSAGSAGTRAVLRRVRVAATVLVLTAGTAGTLIGVAGPASADVPAVDVLPTITVPADFSVDESPAGSGHAVVPFDVSATGAVDPATMDLGCADGAVGVVSPATLSVGVHSITCTATDDAGSTSGSFTVTVRPVLGGPDTPPEDTPPVADAGGPYTVTEGQPLHLDASHSSDSDGDPLTYAWDLNGDGVFDDATGVSPTLAWSQLASRSINDGPATFQARVRVDDGLGGVTDSAATTLTVVNAPPVSFIGGSPNATSGLSVNFVLSSTDPSVVDQAAGFAYTVSWGDGSSEGPFHGAGAVVHPHVYTAPGSYTVTLTTVDKDGGVSAPVTKTVTVVQLVADVCGSAGKTLLVGGTSGDDVITVGPGTSSTIAVTVNGVAESVPVSAFATVVVTAGAGNDTVTFSGTLAVPRFVYGGTGNDILVGGDGPAVLVGGAGNDTLTGGAARDILIGGLGADSLSGNGDDDVLIPGATLFDPVPATASLCALQAEWIRTDIGVLGRTLHLLGVGIGRNGRTHFILVGRERNVGEQNCGDRASGGAGNDLIL